MLTMLRNFAFQSAHKIFGSSELQLQSNVVECPFDGKSGDSDS